MGTDHPITSTTLSNLAFFYQNQGEYAEAERLYRRALLIREQRLGADHPDTATTLNNLAVLYHKQRKDAEAEPLYWRALVIREQKLGIDHPDTVFGLNNLAGFYQQQGKDAEAELLYRRALSIYEQQVGADHPNLATSLNNLALFYSSQGKYTQAEPLLRRALAISEQQFGTQHPTTPSARDTDKAPCFARVITRAKQGAKNVFRRFSRRSLTDPSQTSHAIPTVTSIPTPPVAWKPAAITYNGYLAATASSITMHWGYNNWNSITDTGMTKQRNGTWQASIIVPPGATALNITFHNQSHTWDNNNNSNYHLNVRNVSKR